VKWKAGTGYWISDVDMYPGAVIKIGWYAGQEKFLTKSFVSERLLDRCSAYLWIDGG